MTIPIFIASSDRFAEAEWLTEFSIRENTTAEVDIRIVRPQLYGMQESGCTGFTNVRWAIPQLCRGLGYPFGIYLDVDMLVTGDIAELYEYREEGRRVVLQDGSDEVAVICSSLQYPDKKFIHARHKGTFHRGFDKPAIPLEWNCEDAPRPGMKLLHFTDLNTQPWFTVHPNKAATDVYESYLGRHWSKPDAGRPYFSQPV